MGGLRTCESPTWHPNNPQHLTRHESPPGLDSYEQQQTVKSELCKVSHRSGTFRNNRQSEIGGGSVRKEKRVVGVTKGPRRLQLSE